jgi:hypothetical protein
MSSSNVVLTAFLPRFNFPFVGEDRIFSERGGSCTYGVGGGGWYGVELGFGYIRGRRNGCADGNLN